MLLSRKTGNRRPRRYVFGHNRETARTPHAVAYGQIIANTGPTTKYGIIADLCATAHHDIRQNHTMFANLDIMGKMHKVINLCSSADSRMSDFGPIDARTGSNLHVVFNLHAADMRYLVMAALVKVEAQSITADHDIRVQHDSIADQATVANDHTRPELAPLAHDRAFPDEDSRVEHGMRSNRGVRLDDHMRPEK